MTTVKNELPRVQIVDRQHPHFEEYGRFTGNVIQMKFGTREKMAEVKLEHCRHGVDGCFVKAGEVRQVTELKALTVCQPYAELIARGLKPIENRTWPTPYRGPLLIHAGKSRDWMDDGDLEAYPDMAFGAIVAIVELVDCKRVDDLPVHLRHHEHANGPWCWVLSHIQRIGPLPARGAQGLWDFEGAQLDAVLSR